MIVRSQEIFVAAPDRDSVSDWLSKWGDKLLVAFDFVGQEIAAYRPRGLHVQEPSKKGVNVMLCQACQENYR